MQRTTLKTDSRVACCCREENQSCGCRQQQNDKSFSEMSCGFDHSLECQGGVEHTKPNAVTKFFDDDDVRHRGRDGVKRIDSVLCKRSAW